MKRLIEIKARIIQKSGNQSGVSAGNMKIPGMKIGTQISPGGPTYEDIAWLIEKVELARIFMLSCKFERETDRLSSEKIIHDIDNGR